MILFLPSADNTAATTVDVDGIGAVAIQHNGSALSGGEIKSGRPAIIVNDGTYWQLANPMGVAVDAELSALAGLTSAADKVPYFTGSGTADVATFTSFGRSLVAAADAAAGRAVLTPFPSGTVMLFAQSTAPTGWTKSTSHNDKALRVVSGSASSGGTTAFSSVFTSRTITTSNMPAHSHGVTDPTHTHSYSVWTPGGAGYSYDNVGGSTMGLTAGTSGGASTGISIQNAGSGVAMDFSVKYVDVILATKD